MKENIIFHVVDNIPNKPEPNSAYLINDKWDDWGKYQTQYFLIFYDCNLDKHEIGAVKIAQKGLQPSSCIEKCKRRANIHNEFTRLSNNFFSLGSNIDYYENLNNLPDKDIILSSLRDCAYDHKIYDTYKEEYVLSESLMRDMTNRYFNKLIEQATGCAKATPYNFTYIFPDGKLKFNIKVDPKSIPPSNIYAIIGSNGVGKTTLLMNLYKAASLKKKEKYKKQFGEIDFKNDKEHIKFSKVVVISFNSFDKLDKIKNDDLTTSLCIYGWCTYKEYKVKDDFDTLFQYTHKPEKLILNEKDSEPAADSADNNLWISRIFKQIRPCLYGSKKKRMFDTLSNLENDPIFLDASIKSLLTVDENELYEQIELIYNSLSSGHRIILLTAVHLVNSVEEETLVIIDEPETHLHPPLLSAYIRALSELLKNRNAVAVIATHSPIVLQEIPRNCVYKLLRSGNETNIFHPQIETFGENVEMLTREVFGLEAMSTGFNKFITEIAKRYPDEDYNYIVSKIFNGQLGTEGQAILLTLLHLYKTSYEKN